MTSINPNHLISQMQALESLASGHSVQTEIKVDEAKSFSNLMKRAVDQVNETQMQATDLSKAFEMGDSKVDLSEVMIAIQKSRVSFQALTEVRNKLLTAYQDVMNMPV
jgi:flagellar hook-basal body complex protein FliE